jgi:hypothetical protein
VTGEEAQWERKTFSTVRPEKVPVDQQEAVEERLQLRGVLNPTGMGSLLFPCPAQPLDFPKGLPKKKTGKQNKSLKNKPESVTSESLFPLFFCSAGKGTDGLALARQVLY